MDGSKALLNPSVDLLFNEILAEESDHYTGETESRSAKDFMIVADFLDMKLPRTTAYELLLKILRKNDPKIYTDYIH